MPKITELSPGHTLPGRSYQPDNVQLFLYDAALWNAHRIHFDYPYATGVEGYPGLVVAGPLIGEWLAQCVVEWLGDDGRLVAIEYSNRKASFVGETLRSGGTVTAVDRERGEATLDLYVRNELGEIITPGTATVRFAQS
jgi:hydroxyacyl-ACP dehydratase HTD2-like protein with hotdog domain